MQVACERIGDSLIVGPAGSTRKVKVLDVSHSGVTSKACRAGVESIRKFP